MSQNIKETAHLNVDKEKYDEGHARIFGNKEETANWITATELRIRLSINWASLSEKDQKTIGEIINDRQAEVERVLEEIRNGTRK